MMKVSVSNIDIVMGKAIVRFLANDGNEFFLFKHETNIKQKYRNLLNYLWISISNPMILFNSNIDGFSSYFFFPFLINGKETVLVLFQYQIQLRIIYAYWGLMLSFETNDLKKQKKTSNFTPLLPENFDFQSKISTSENL